MIDDFGPKRLTTRQGSDLYAIIIEHHERSSTNITSNRTIDEWIPLFDDPRLGHATHQITIEGEFFRSRQRPGQITPTQTTSTPTTHTEGELRLGQAHEKS